MFNQLRDEFIIENHGKISLNSGLPEFGYELIAILPYAYYLFQHGLLANTCSGYDTKGLYFFSPEHCEVSGKRSWDNVRLLQNSGFPNAKIHQAKLDLSQFSPPPLKEHYASSAIRFAKPTIVICNRYNQEWNGTPVNFISPACLAQLFDLLCDKYQIVYIDTQYFTGNYSDHADFLDSPCQQVVLEYSGRILTFLDLQANYPELSLNELQCRLYAGCERFISSNGGLGIFCSYFGGENIIFSKTCHELDPEINSFYAWYGLLSGTSIKVVSAEDKLIELVIAKWVRKDLMYNVIIKYNSDVVLFYNSIRSVLELDYINYNLIIDATECVLQDVTCVYPAMIAYNANDIDILTKVGYNLFLDLQEVVSSSSILKCISDLVGMHCSSDEILSYWVLNKKIVLNNDLPATNHKSKRVVIISCNSQFSYLESCLDSLMSQNKNDSSVKVMVAISDKKISRYKSLTRQYIGRVDFYYTTELLTPINLVCLAHHKNIYRDSLVIAISANVLLPVNYLTSIFCFQGELELGKDLYRIPQLLIMHPVRQFLQLIISKDIDECDLLRQLDYHQQNFFNVGLQLLLSSKPISVKLKVRDLLHDRIRYANLRNLQEFRLLTDLKNNTLAICGTFTAFEKNITDVSNLQLLDKVMPIVSWLDFDAMYNNGCSDVTTITKLSKLQ